MTNSHIEVTLSNGLKVLLKEIHTAPIVSSWLWYRVGSRDEVQGRTGISHWVEHMQFKGTPQFPSNVLDKAISREGGVWNAMTYLDWTTYYETMPAEKIDLGLRLESDRMVNSQFDSQEVASERTVIISEREGNENEPLFMLGEAVQQTAFRVHPYHHEVIGDMADLHTMTRDDLYNHYREFYVPNNAILAIAGDFETGKMLARIKELFEPIPAGKEPTRVARPELPQNGEVRLAVEGPGSTSYVQVCYRFPAASHPDFFPLAVLDSLLAGPSNLNMFSGGISNKTSRLYRALVDKELTVSVHGGAQVTIDPFLYGITMTIHPKRKPEEALAALDKEIKRVQEEKISKEEIARAIKQARALFAYGSENITNQAFWMGYAEIFARYEWFQTYLDKLAKVTAKDIQRVANEYFKPQSRVVGTYVPLGGRAK
ncbi:MAG: insulinase family protein [Anaerolineae bacterium]|nr:MAG: insulinase family protein [Anaerolineae bacterium]WKZ44881.1 MAG: pitrilysin family protein [Anaerolineales bacterium]